MGKFNIAIERKEVSFSADLLREYSEVIQPTGQQLL